MDLWKIKELLDCKVLANEDKLDTKIDYICASELMSSVLTCNGNNKLLVTGLNNLQVIRTAEMSDIPAIIFVQNRKPSVEIIELAKDKEIVIMLTNCSLFKVCGLLFQAGLRSGHDELKAE
jgi:predicted transcriptional regulator